MQEDFLSHGMYFTPLFVLWIGHRHLTTDKYLTSTILPSNYLFLSTGPRGTGSLGVLDFFFFPSRRKPEPENAWKKNCKVWLERRYLAVRTQNLVKKNYRKLDDPNIAKSTKKTCCLERNLSLRRRVMEPLFNELSYQLFVLSLLIHVCWDGEPAPSFDIYIYVRPLVASA